MSSLQIVGTMVAVSTTISLAMLFTASDTRRRLLSLISLFCPVVGPLFFFCSWICDRAVRKSGDLQMSDIGFDKSRRSRIQAPDYDAEIQTVPLEETFLISQAGEKRRRLLNELKKERIDNYTTLMKALEDDDAETSHYAATAIVNAKTEFENNLRELDNLYNKPSGKDDLELVRRYGDYLLAFLRCGILSEIERKKYSRLYVHVMTSVENAADFLTPDDYEGVVSESLFLGDYSTADDWAHRALAAYQTEKTYLILMKLYYRTAQADKLEKTLEALRSSRIPLSGEGLATVRFFMNGRRAGA